MDTKKQELNKTITLATHLPEVSFVPFETRKLKDSELVWMNDSL